MNTLDDGALRASVWSFCLARLAELKANLAMNPADAEIEQTLSAVEDSLLLLQAPDLGAVVLKLEMLWSAQLDGADPDTCARRNILNDLRRLAG